jgi:hypothetical protein
LLLLTALICQKQPERGRRVAARLLQRYLEQTPDATIEDVAVIASLLTALGGSRHEHALVALLDMTGTTTSSGANAAVRSV